MEQSVVVYQDERFRISAIHEEELLQALEVYRLCEDFLALGPEPKASEKMVRADFEYSKEENGLYCGVFDAKENIVGIVDFIPHSFGGSSENAFITLVMIAGPYRNKGLGTKIVEAVEKFIASYPQNRAILSAVQTNNGKAVKFWTTLGYRIVGEPESRPDNTVVFNLRKDLQR